MSTILIADDNPDILTLVGETLRAAGHEVLPTVNPSRVTSLLDGNPVDAAVLDVVMPPISGLDLLKEIRAQPRWKNLPVLLLSGLGDTEDRVRGIREGADDYLAKPFEPAELVARVERLIARRAGDVGLSGNLEDFAPADIAQNLAQSTKTGCLSISSEQRVVEVFFIDGKIRGAKTGSLLGDEALLSLLSLTSGHFSFEAADEGDIAARSPGEPCELNSVLLEAAWLEDELNRRRPNIGRENPLLKVVGPKPTSVEEDFESLPFERIYEYLVQQPNTGVLDLVKQEIDAPLRILLSVALLLEAGSIEARSQTGAAAPESKKRPDDPLGELLLTCRDRGSSETIYLLILFQPDAWKELLRMAQSIPPERLAGERDQLLDELIMRGSGTVRVTHPEGVVVLNLKPLRGDRLQGAALLSLASGVILWLDGSAPPDALAQYITNVDGAGDRSRGVIQTPETDALPGLASLIEGHGHWTLNTQPINTVADLANLLI